MAKLKLKKLPRKPKASASLATMEGYLKKVAEIKKHNQGVVAHNKRIDSLRKQISGITAAHVSPGGGVNVRSVSGVGKRRKRSTGKKSAAKKSTGRKRRK